MIQFSQSTDKANGRRSVSDVAETTLGNTAVNTSSMIQHCVMTLSTSDAEYVTMAQGVNKVLFTRAGLEFLCPQRLGRIIDLFEDNHLAVAKAENLVRGNARGISTCDTTLSGSH